MKRLTLLEMFDLETAEKISNFLKELGITSEQFKQDPSRYVQVAMKHFGLADKEQKVRPV